LQKFKIKNNNIKYKAEIYMVEHENRDYEGLLGIDFLRKHQAIIDVTGLEMTLCGHKESLTSRADEDRIHVETLRMDVINPSEPRSIHLTLILPYAVDVAPKAAKVIFLDVPNKETDRRNEEYIVDPLQCNEILDEIHIYCKKHQPLYPTPIK
jgi:hypothetical protein